MYASDYHGKLPGECFLFYSYPGGHLSGPYMPYVKNTAILACQKKGSYGYNISLTALVDYDNWAWVPGAIAVRCRVHKELGHGEYPRSGRMLSDFRYPGRVMAFMCGLPDGSGANGWEWEPHDIGDGYASRMANRHNDGTTYAFLDGHVRCLKPTGTKYCFPVATDGIDYDGDGICGTVDFMR
jgi:prepilin-type processing-associated H-X9-DG protein